MDKIKNFFKEFKHNWPRYRARLFGSGGRKGFIYYLLVYFLSITFAFVFLYPIFYMFMISLMSNTDLVDSTIMWIPSKIFIQNYQFAYRGLGLNVTFFQGTWDILNAGTDVDETIALYTTMEKIQHIEFMKFVMVALLPVAFTVLGSLYSENKGRLLGLSIFATILLMVLPDSFHLNQMAL